MTGYSRDAIVHQGRLDAGVSLLQKPLTQYDLNGWTVPDLASYPDLRGQRNRLLNSTD